MPALFAQSFTMWQMTVSVMSFPQTQPLRLTQRNSHTGRVGPFVAGCLHPIRNRDGTDMPALAHQIDQRPVFLPLLDVAKLKLGRLCPAQAAAQQNCEDGSVAPFLQRLSVWRLQQAPALNPRSANCQGAHRVSWPP
jgi:hypothetical protein